MTGGSRFDSLRWNRTRLIPVFLFEILMTNTALPARKLPSLLLFTSAVALVAAFGAQFEPGAWLSFIIVSRRYSVAASWLFVPR